MNCYKHNNKNAVSQCKKCGKGLCSDCLNDNENNEGLCLSCYFNNLKSKKQTTLNLLISSLIIFVFLILFSIKNNAFSSSVRSDILLFYSLASIPIGWNAIFKLNPKSPIGWFFYFNFKVALAAIVGQVLLPFKIFEFFKLKSKIKKSDKELTI